MLKVSLSSGAGEGVWGVLSVTIDLGVVGAYWRWGWQTVEQPNNLVRCCLCHDEGRMCSVLCIFGASCALTRVCCYTCGLVTLEHDRPGDSARHEAMRRRPRLVRRMSRTIVFPMPSPLYICIHACVIISLMLKKGRCDAHSYARINYTWQCWSQWNELDLHGENTEEVTPPLPEPSLTETQTIYATASRLHDNLANNIYGEWCPPR